MLELLVHGAKTDTAAAQLDHVCRRSQAGKKQTCCNCTSARPLVRRQQKAVGGSNGLPCTPLSSKTYCFLAGAGGGYCAQHIAVLCWHCTNLSQQHHASCIKTRATSLANLSKQYHASCINIKHHAYLQAAICAA